MKMTQMTKYVLDRIENIVGKKENAGCQRFCLSLQKALILLKVGIVW